MVSVIDLGLVNYFSIIFPFLLIFSLVFAILQKVKIIGDSPVINAVVAFSAAMLAILSDTVVAMIVFIAPWFVVVFVFLILLLMAFQILGAKDADLALAVRDKSVQWVILGIAIVIILAGFGNVMGQDLLEQSQQTGETVDSSGELTDSGDFDENLMTTLFHPKVLGLIVLFGIAIFSVALLTN
ncbi:hypothetical protein HN385_00595 [archaeon]|jgi:hypothetical protein|nr:hypothetical protein [archaeon]MBT3451578.1 hypothetical protein [archaeon]MBT6869598.1 hypothetical protein [archaeon]MBT7192367.1 hypothetical protein [archaeon]MBT7380168.1 hypothetical protein [archaeon]